MSDKPVDRPITVVVGPCVDAATFVPVTDIAYDAAGLRVDWFQEKADGSIAVTSLVLTAAGENDWAHIGDGYYSVEITTAQNNAVGAAWAAGSCPGVMAFESPHYEIVPIAVYDNPPDLGALHVISLVGLQAYSSLAEVQALTNGTLEPLEQIGIDLLESELGRRITLDDANTTVRIQASGLALMPLPERLDTLVSVVSDGLGDITSEVETVADGWLLRPGRSVYPRSLYGQFNSEYQWGFRTAVSVNGLWGWTCPDRVRRVLMDVVEALAVRRADGVSRRDELSPWGNVRDGDLSADRDSVHRAATLENLLRYDVKIRLHGAYRPSIIGAV